MILPRLWQRILGYAILLVLASHAVSFVMFRYVMDRSHHVRLIREVTAGMVEALDGRDLETAEVFIDFFDRQPRRVWIELPDGTLLAGDGDERFGPQARVSLKEAPHGQDSIQVHNLPDSRQEFYATAAITLDGRDAMVFVSLGEAPPFPMLMVFMQGLVAVSIIGGSLGIWVTWRISRPLRRLRGDVLSIADGNLDCRVREEGPVEISEVASAVNRMAGNLARMITSMRELIANISHEMRSPLARMNFSTAIIEENMQGAFGRTVETSLNPANDLVVKHIARLQSEIAHLEKLIGSSLFNSRLELQKDAVAMEPLELTGLCRDFLLRYEEELARSELFVVSDLCEAVRVEGDEALLGQLFANLLDNALKYTSPGGHIRVSLEERDHQARLEVENSHSALEPGVLERIFEPFYRAGLGTGDQDGVGLGLSLCRKIAHLHGGTITAENSEDGILFRLSLPLAVSGRETDRDFLRWFFSRHES